MKITEREKAAIIYQLITGASWPEVYTIARNAKLEDIPSTANLASTAVRWRNSEKIRAYYDEQKTLLEAREKAQAERIRAEVMKEQETGTGESEKTNGKKGSKTGAKIDYNNPENRLQLYNDIITQAQDDPKTQLDAAKLLEQIQKDDRTAAKEQRQTRFYLPQTCDSCPFYAKKAGKR